MRRGYVGTSDKMLGRMKRHWLEGFRTMSTFRQHHGKWDVHKLGRTTNGEAVLVVHVVTRRDGEFLSW